MVGGVCYRADARRTFGLGSLGDASLILFSKSAFLPAAVSGAGAAPALTASFSNFDLRSFVDAMAVESVLACLRHGFLHQITFVTASAETAEIVRLLQIHRVFSQ